MVWNIDTLFQNFILTQFIFTDLNDPHHIVDVCGDKQENESVFNEVGYIESMNYPQPYSPDMECSCKLEVSEPETEIILTVLDMKMSDDSCMVFIYIYLKYFLDLNEEFFG